MILKLQKIVSNIELTHCRIDVEARVKEDMRREMSLALMTKLEKGKLYTIEKHEIEYSLLPNGNVLRDDGLTAREEPERRADLMINQVIYLNEVDGDE